MKISICLSSDVQLDHKMDKLFSCMSKTIYTFFEKDGNDRFMHLSTTAFHQFMISVASFSWHHHSSGIGTHCSLP